MFEPGTNQRPVFFFNFDFHFRFSILFGHALGGLCSLKTGSYYRTVQ